ncbi:DUF2318 domain-containing protein [Aristaeella hokkaidonensis]|uniref:DUF2318 domain-containing protein n=1 Tax=Aristaeella hokkaidonensis TaxID=3046382 RepID=A0AC61MUP2_9FIRM|nr:DUF2318 domain-containing protein [Aristaeella hokkaidonensis]QUC66069.1 DUF2318 domain-containing protein [Aristaeella hokkaidonensis]SNT93700.1 Predicted membrane protein [Aristaeella hokkaidonensis]
MLYYLWSVIQDLFYTVTITTLMHAFLGRLYGRTGRRGHVIGLIAGVAAGTALAVVKQTTNKIISSHWNHWTYAYLMAFIVAFFMLSLFLGRKEGKKPAAGGICLILCGAAVSAGMIFFRLPTVLLYPFSFNTMGNGFFSAYYMERLGGWALALLLLFVYSRLLYGCAVHIRKGAVPRRVLRAGVLIYAVYCLGRFFVPWISRAKWLGWSVKYTEAQYGWIGSFAMWTATNAMIFIWIIAALAALLALLFLLENTRVTEPYEHAAQLRKLRAGNRKRRRLAIATLVMILLFVLTLTVVKAYDTREVVLSAPETYTVDGDRILVSAESVNDGHLHRFEYTTERNVTIRWIVVKKPNSATYGVGFDACEVCGSAGYYERGSQVVCKRCDVVMNINTIGFKGGCNPIPLAYEVGDGNLVFRLEDLLSGEKEFR